MNPTTSAEDPNLLFGVSAADLQSSRRERSAIYRQLMLVGSWPVSGLTDSLPLSSELLHGALLQRIVSSMGKEFGLSSSPQDLSSTDRSPKYSEICA